MAQTKQAASADTPMDRLKSEARDLAGALGDRAVSSVRDRLQETTGRLAGYVEGGAGPGLMAAVTGAKNMAEGKGPVRSMLGAGFKGLMEKFRGQGKGGGGKGKKLKVTSIIESIDVGVPLRTAYNQWTQFGDFPGFMKKVESVETEEDGQKLNWKAQVLWSHRNWEATIQQQHPDESIVWRSKGAKGYVDGSVTFHELAPNLTRILVVLEYNPQGLFEHTGNIWRAQGRRARLELKHFRRHVMSEAILHPDEIEGWRGVIEDGEVVKDHETAMSEEQGQDQPEDIEARDQGGPAEDQAEDTEDQAEDTEEAAEDEEDEEDEEARSGDGRPGRAPAADRGRSGSRRPAGAAPRSGRPGRGDQGSRRAARGAVRRRGGS
jgi:Polyketide cyclase / dehydrase and lipid transport